MRCQDVICGHSSCLLWRQIFHKNQTKVDIPRELDFFSINCKLGIFSCSIQFFSAFLFSFQQACNEVVTKITRQNKTKKTPFLGYYKSGPAIFFFEFLNFILFIFFIQQFLISYPFYTYQCIYVNPNLPVHPTATPPPLACNY